MFLEPGDHRRHRLRIAARAQRLEGGPAHKEILVGIGQRGQRPGGPPVADEAQGCRRPATHARQGVLEGRQERLDRRRADVGQGIGGRVAGLLQVPPFLIGLRLGRRHEGPKPRPDPLAERKACRDLAYRAWASFIGQQGHEEGNRRRGLRTEVAYLVRRQRPLAPIRRVQAFDGIAEVRRQAPRNPPVGGHPLFDRRRQAAGVRHLAQAQPSQADDRRHNRRADEQSPPTLRGRFVLHLAPHRLCPCISSVIPLPLWERVG